MIIEFRDLPGNNNLGLTFNNLRALRESVRMDNGKPQYAVPEEEEDNSSNEDSEANLEGQEVQNMNSLLFDD